MYRFCAGMGTHASWLEEKQNRTEYVSAGIEKAAPHGTALANRFIHIMRLPQKPQQGKQRRTGQLCFGAVDDFYSLP